MLTNSSNITVITGTTNDASPSSGIKSFNVWLNGVQETISGNWLVIVANFTANITNTVIAEIEDNAGNISRATNLVVVDTTPPTCTILSPANNQLVGQHFQLNILNSDNMRLYQLSILTNGVLYTNIINPGNSVNLAMGFSVSTSNKIQAFTVDTAGNYSITNSVSISNVFTGAQFYEATPNAAFHSREYHTSLTNNNLMWVIAGCPNSGGTNDVWYSSDGTNWNCATNAAAFPARNSQSGVLFKGSMWVIGGYSASGTTNDVWYSSDGTNWFCATNNAAFSARCSHASVVFNGNMWVIGGGSAVDMNDVWYSPDGTNWNRATSAAAFSIRDSFTSLVYDNKIWVIGGLVSGTTKTNDVWYSSDGTNWTCATNEASFSGRYLSAGTVFDNKMWVIGGSSSMSLNDVWCSTKGTNWTCATNSAGFSTRDGHAVLPFNNTIWVIGGNGGSGNDVWYGE